MNKEISFGDLCAVKDMVAALTSLEKRLLSKTGLNLNQAFALCCLSKGPKTAGALADQLKISAPSLSRIIKKLVSLDLINRDVNSADGRNRVMNLSTQGQKKALELLEIERRIFPWKVNFLEPTEVNS